MARQLRKTSSTGIYHVVFRGVNHCNLFEERRDFETLLEIFTEEQKRIPFSIYAYCLMDNHVHLLIREDSPGDIAVVMRDVLAPYASGFNYKYQRNGALIADRYKRECVQDEHYLLAAVRYIHQNPVRAGMVSTIGNYRWSSYRDYVSDRPAFAQTDFVLSLFSEKRSEAIQEFISFHETTEDRDCSLSGSPRRPEEQIRSELLAALNGTEPNALCGLPKPERNEKLAALRKRGFSIRQIERATGISKAIIERCR